ncbi:MAG: hypothetical protein ACK5K8_14765, partial [Pseudanabaena sp.]
FFFIFCFLAGRWVGPGAPPPPPPTTSTSSLINSFGLRESYIALSNGVTNGDGEPLKSFSWNIRRNW